MSATDVMLVNGLVMLALAAVTSLTDRRRLTRQRKESEDVLESFRKANEAHRRRIDEICRRGTEGGT